MICLHLGTVPISSTSLGRDLHQELKFPQGSWYFENQGDQEQPLSVTSFAQFLSEYLGFVCTCVYQ